MKCPDCGIEMMIKRTRYIEDETAPRVDGEPKKMLAEQDLMCRNKQCANYNTIVETAIIEIK